MPLVVTNLSGNTVPSGVLAATANRTELVNERVELTLIFDKEYVLSCTVAHGLWIRSLPVSELAVALPVFKNVAESSIVSPASKTPSLLPIDAPVALSSTVML